MARGKGIIDSALLLAMLFSGSAWVWSQDTSAPAAQNNSPAASPEDDAPKPKKKLAKDPPGMKRLLPDEDLWIDPANKRVVLDGSVCLVQGQLEMLACPKGTKEHESVISADVKAYAVHAALLAVGAKPGTPVRYRPSYQAASGTIVDVTLIWTDEKGEVRRQRGQDWVRDVESKKPMPHNWIFAGSGIWKDDMTGETRYLAEGGEFICVSNFPGAMLDLPIPSSSQAEQGLLFEAFTENIPPRGTRVRMVLTPRLEKQ